MGEIINGRNQEIWNYLFILKYYKWKNRRFINKKDNILLTIIASDHQNNNDNKNESTIKLGKLENKLREYYNISDNEFLLIFKIDIYDEKLSLPIIKYKIIIQKKI